MEKDQLITLLISRGYSDKIISAFKNISREIFIPENLSAFSYEDIPLKIESGSLLPKPTISAFILHLLDLEKDFSNFLEIGSGTGYTLALVSEISPSARLFGLEINQRLAIKSKSILENNQNIKIFNRSGFSGLPEKAPFDRILISASCNDLSFPERLLDQLSENGVLVVPIKSSLFQIKKENGIITEKEFPGFSFPRMLEDF